ncbi:MAG: rhamnulokinase family protein [Prolixibacteraceae bacterium]|jgi:rhamnulokinase|nr:rhamnulokinase family protein [Prolixibacteraceae bacterium]
MNRHHFLAFDIGASSGRAILGTLNEGKLELTEIHRFENQMQLIHGNYFWNIFSLFEELKTGLKKCIRDFHIQPESIGIDTWGVDFVHLDKEGRIISLPFAYRDSRTDRTMEELFQLISREEIYLQTGIQFMQFNSLFQLFSMVRSGASILRITSDILFMPDALAYLFSGVKKTEFSIASTSQMLRPGTNQWQSELIKKTGIDDLILREIVWPGTIIGDLLPEVTEQTGSSKIPVVAVAGHDTASAVASVPAEGANWAFISSGTWSIMGVESPVPIISEETLKMNFTNEGGVEGTTRFSKNIMGMWLIQECRRIWSKEKEYSWPEMVELARQSEPFRYIVDPDAPSFLNPQDMPGAISVFCERTGQGRPQTHGEIIRCIYDSLALKYRFTLDQIIAATGRKIEKIHIIGGGSNNHFLCQLAADATGLPVFAGPAEATATGNILIQAKALEYVKSLGEIREIVRHSFGVIRFGPSGELNWEIPFEKFKNRIMN